MPGENALTDVIVTMSSPVTSEVSEKVLRASRFLNLSIFSLGALTAVLIAFYFTFLDITIQNFLPVMTAGTVFVITWIFKNRIEDPEIKNHELVLFQWIALCSVIIALSLVTVIFYPVS